MPFSTGNKGAAHVTFPLNFCDGLRPRVLAGAK
jgi:hypothetical protein